MNFMNLEQLFCNEIAKILLVNIHAWSISDISSSSFFMSCKKWCISLPYQHLFGCRSTSVTYRILLWLSA